MLLLIIRAIHWCKLPVVHLRTCMCDTCTCPVACMLEITSHVINRVELHVHPSTMFAFKFIVQSFIYTCTLICCELCLFICYHYVCIFILGSPIMYIVQTISLNSCRENYIVHVCNGHHKFSQDTLYIVFLSQSLFRFLKAYDEHDVRMWGLTVQNEPTAGLVPIYKWQCMAMEPHTMRDFIKMDLGPALQLNGYGHLKLMTHDDNLPGIFEDTETVCRPKKNTYLLYQSVLWIIWIVYVHAQIYCAWNRCSTMYVHVLKMNTVTEHCWSWQHCPFMYTCTM